MPVIACTVMVLFIEYFFALLSKTILKRCLMLLDFLKSMQTVIAIQHKLTVSSKDPLSVCFMTSEDVILVKTEERTCPQINICECKCREFYWYMMASILALQVSSAYILWRLEEINESTRSLERSQIGLMLSGREGAASLHCLILHSSLKHC